MSKEEKKLFLLDAYALVYRAHFAFSNNPRISSKGVNTGVMFGFTNTLLEVLQKQKPSHIAVVFDTSAPTFRHEQYEEYKANRQETPEDIRQGIPVVKDIVKGFNIPVIELDGYEADDLIGTIAKKASKDGFEVFMMTPDKDFGQLVEDKIFLYKPAYMGNAVDVLGVEEVKAKWNIEDVDQVRDMLGLQGDSSDNIPGIPGIGPKTASKLLAAYGSVEGIVKNVGDLKGKQKETIEEFGPQGIMSKELATIVTDAPIDINWEDLEYSGPDEKILKPIFQDLEFRTLMKRVFDSSEGPSVSSSGKAGQLDMFGQGNGKDEGNEVTAALESPLEGDEFKNSIQSNIHRYHLIGTAEKRQELIRYLSLQNQVSIETISDDPNPINAHVLGLSFCYYDDEAYYVPLPSTEEATAQLLKEFRDVFEKSELEWTGHNIKYEILWLKKYGIDLNASIFDTLLAHYLIDPETPHNVEILADSYLNYQILEENSSLMDKGKRSAKIRKLSEKEQLNLACESADVTRKVAQSLKAEIKQKGLEKLLYELELPLVHVLASMECSGVKLDVSELQKMSSEIEGITSDLESDIFSIAGTEFNINSPKQLGEILFERLKLLEKPRKTKSGQYATGEEVLKKLSDHEIVGKILEYRELQKLRSTYVDALPGMISEWDGKIHTNYSQAVAATGRLSSINPNIQNIPIRTERGRLIRKAFVATSDEYQILSADYSQIELRIIASFAKDETMIESFRNGEDIHAATASKIFSVPLSDVDANMRRKAKSVNFGLIYGQTAFGLAENLNISRTEAKEIIEAYFTQFPAVKSYMDRIVNEARENEYVETILGRRRYLRDINSRNQTMRGYAERNAINAPIQGSAADIIKMAMIDIHAWMEKEKLKSKMIMQVHDELVFEVHESETGEFTDTVISKMTSAVNLEVPMVVESGIGKDWLTAH